MTYEERKAQLNKAMADFINNKENNGVFILKEETIIILNFVGEKREENLIDLSTCVNDERVVRVHTYADEEDFYCDFTDLSNEEMEQIMLKCGVEIPHSYYVVTFTTTITRVYNVDADCVADAIEKGKTMVSEYDSEELYETWDAE